MAQIVVHDLDDDVIAALKLRADLAGKSLEQSVRDLLPASAPLSAEEKVAISRRLRADFAEEKWDTRAAIRWGRDDEFLDLERKFDSP